jgi:putative FmdB family regulatory protein
MRYNSESKQEFYGPKEAEKAMPTYVYACDTCGKQFEKFQSFKEDALQECPCEQKSNAIRRVFQPAGIVFKGSGWYVTDSRRSADSSTSSSTTSSTETKDNKGDKAESTTSKTESTAPEAAAAD